MLLVSQTGVWETGLRLNREFHEFVFGIVAELLKGDSAETGDQEFCIPNWSLGYSG